MESAHHFPSRPDCNSTVDVPSLILRTALSAIPLVSDLCGVDVEWLQERSSQDLPNSRELSLWMTSGFLVGSKNFWKLFCVSLEVFVLHGYDCIHCVAKSCTTTAYRWLFRDSHPSLRILWSAVIKTPKYSDLGTTVPVRFLQGSPCTLGSQADIAISVLREVRKNAVPYTIPLLLAALKVTHEKKGSRCSGTLSYSWTPVAILGNHATSFLVLPRCRHFCLDFRSLPVHATGFLVLPHSYSHFLLMVDAPWESRHAFLRWRCRRSRWRWSWRTCQ